MSSIGKLIVYYTSILVIQELYEKAQEIITTRGLKVCQKANDKLAIGNLLKTLAFIHLIKIENKL